MNLPKKKTPNTSVSIESKVFVLHNEDTKKGFKI